MSFEFFIRCKSSFARLFVVCLCSFTPFICPASTSVTLDWDPSPSPEVTGYKIYYGVASATYTNMVSTANSPSATISGLVPGQLYYFAATATDGTGVESDYSNEATCWIPSVSTQLPTLDTLANVTIVENAGAQTINLSGITSGSSNEVQTLTVTVTSGNTALIPNPTVSYSSPNATGSLTFTPVASASGSTTITVTVNDGGASNNIVTRSFEVTVTPANQPPTLDALANLTIAENAGVQTVYMWGITSGATNEIQTLTVTVTSSNPGLIPNPVVSYLSGYSAGTFAFTPVPLASGTTAITVTVNDGGAINNTFSRSFQVTVNPVNQTPTLNSLVNLTINENAGVQTVNLAGITSGAGNESQTLTVTANSGNSALIPNPTVSYVSPNSAGTISFTPAANAHGQAVITVTVSDGGASNNFLNRPFTVTVNQRPTISAIANRIVSIGTPTPAIPFTIGDGETATGSLTLTGTSSNLALVSNAGIVFGGAGANRTVIVTPLPGQSGSANITLTVSDGQATSSSVFQVRTKPAAPGNLQVAVQ